MTEEKNSPEELVRESMMNSYMIITDKLTFSDLFEYNGCSLPFNPKKTINNQDIDKIIDYFCTTRSTRNAQSLKN